MKRQIKDYYVTIGTVDKTTDNPAFGGVTVKATDALAAAVAVDKNLGKRQYVAAVSLVPVAPLAYAETGALPTRGSLENEGGTIQ